MANDIALTNFVNIWMSCVMVDFAEYESSKNIAVGSNGELIFEKFCWENQEECIMFDLSKSPVGGNVRWKKKGIVIW